MIIKSIDTEYDGYLFRSRLEARWAVYFNEMGIRYIYEPVGVILTDGSKYLPDFYFPDLESWAEVKGTMLDSFDNHRAQLLCEDSEKPVLVLDGDPGTCYFTLYIPEPDGYGVEMANVIDDDGSFVIKRQMKGKRAFREFGNKGEKAIMAVNKARRKRFDVYKNIDAEILNG